MGKLDSLLFGRHRSQIQTAQNPQIDPAAYQGTLSQALPEAHTAGMPPQ